MPVSKIHVFFSALLDMNVKFKVQYSAISLMNPDVLIAPSNYRFVTIILKHKISSRLLDHSR